MIRPAQPRAHRDLGVIALMLRRGVAFDRQASLARQMAACLVGLVATFAWVPDASAILVRDDLQPVGSPGVGLDDYGIQNLAGSYSTVGYIWNAGLGQYGQWCTGTIISGGLLYTRVITAAHCVYDFDTDPNKGVASAEAKYIDATEATKLSFSLGSPLGNMLGAGFQVTQGWYQGGFVGAAVTPEDVAILQINAPLSSLGGALTPISFADPSTWLGSQATMVGWGAQGAGAANPNLSVVANGFNDKNLRYTDPNTGNVYFASDKLAAQSIIDLNPANYADNLIVADFDRFDGAGLNPLGNRFGLNFEGLTAPGDSGGPIFPVGIDGFVGVLGGSIVAAANCTQELRYDKCSAWAPMSANKSFVLSHIPAPPSLWLVGAGMLALLGVAGKSRRPQSGANAVS